jgi:hypothetical protein
MTNKLKVMTTQIDMSADYCEKKKVVGSSFFLGRIHGDDKIALT